MNKKLLVLLLMIAPLLGVFIAPISVFALTIPYNDDFEDGVADNWTVATGTWDIITDGSKVYHVTANQGIARAVVGDTTWSNYNVEAKVKVNDWGSDTSRTVGLIARYTDNNNYYIFVYENSQLIIKKKVAGTLTTIASKAYTFNTGIWYTFKGAADGNNLTFYVNGQQELTTTDSAFSSGKSGLLSCYANSRFDDYNVTAIASPFPFTQQRIDEAVSEGLVRYTLYLEWDWEHNRSGTSLLYLTNAAIYNPNYQATDGTVIKDRILAHLRNLIKGTAETRTTTHNGTNITYTNEPGCSGGLDASGYNSTIQAIAIAKQFVPSVWNALTQTEKDKLTVIMKAALVSSHWGFDDGNDFNTGINQDGNFKKTWNPNYREGGVGQGIAAAYFLGGPTEANNFLTTFNYDNFIAEVSSYGFLSIKHVFSQTGKTALEAATKNTFTYQGYDLSQPFYWVKALSDHMYSATVASSGAGGLGYILSGASGLPNVGSLGMGLEFDGTDANGGRSSARYVFAGWKNSIVNRNTVQLFGDWGTGADQTAVENKMNIGSTDLIYKLEKGYHDYAKGAYQGDSNEAYVDNVAKYFLLKELWNNVIK